MPFLVARLFGQSSAATYGYNSGKHYQHDPQPYECCLSLCQPTAALGLLCQNQCRAYLLGQLETGRSGTQKLKISWM